MTGGVHIQAGIAGGRAIEGIARIGCCQLVAAGQQLYAWCLPGTCQCLHGSCHVAARLQIEDSRPAANVCLQMQESQLTQGACTFP